MKKFFLLLALASSLSAFADPGTLQSPVNYSCSGDQFSILGTDGTFKSCYPYLCTTAAEAEAHPVCKTHCNKSDECQGGKVCDPAAGTCI